MILDKATLKLSEANMSSYGFARFCFSGEAESFGNELCREIELPDKVSGQLTPVKVVFAQEDLIELSKDKRHKLVSKDSFSLDSVGFHTAPMFLLVQRAGWNQTAEDLKRFAIENPEANILGTAKIGESKIPLGSGYVLKAGAQLSWIGMILVHPEIRRQGVANAIMEMCIEHARQNMDTPVIGLDATPAGLQVYQRIGFRSSFKIWRSILNTDATFIPDERISVTGSILSQSVKDYLNKTGFTEKWPEFQLIEKLYPEGVFIAKSENKIAGMAMTRPGRLRPFVGPLIADDLQTAKNLLAHSISYWKDHGHEDVFVDIPELYFEKDSIWNNEGECEILPEKCKLHQDVQPMRGFIRMYELIDKDEASDLSQQIRKYNKHVRKQEAFDHAVNSYEQTLEYMKLEEEKMLQYMYAIGGPELS